MTGRSVLRPIARPVAAALAVTMAVAVALLVGAAPAFAHTRLESSDPADGSSVAAAPDAVSLTFSEDIQPGFATLTVVGPDGTNYQTGGVTGGGGQVRTSVSPLGPAGTYEIGYRVVSDDGHPVQGKVSFTLTAPGPGAAAATPTAAPGPTPAAAPVAAPATAAVAPQANAQQGGGAPVWPWLVGGVVLVGAGAAAALRLGRRN
jgi:methionine-rich copper-binding protein CopC